MILVTFHAQDAIKVAQSKLYVLLLLSIFELLAVCRAPAPVPCKILAAKPMIMNKTLKISWRLSELLYFYVSK